jgi:putative ABC transport system permease protein
VNLIARVSVALRAGVLRLIGRGSEDPSGILDDVLDLYRERRRKAGRAYAGARAAWDLVTLSVRPQPPARVSGIDTESHRMTRLRDDVRQAWRAVRRRPLVGLTAVATLTVGTTLALLAYTIVDGVLLRPLPFPRSQELLSIFSEFRPESGYTFERFALSAPEILDYQRQSRTVAAAAWQPDSVSITSDDGTATLIRVVRASSEVFRLLETPPALGRVLTSADDAPGAPCVLVLSHPLWQERLGGDGNAVGRRLTLSGESCEIVGVMPEVFAFPTASTRLWLPLALDRDPNTRGDHGLVALGRMKPGVQLQTALTEIRTLMAAWEKEYPHHRGHGIVAAPLRDDLVGSVSDQLLVLACAVGFVLLVIIGNVSALMLAHGEGRRAEFAVRAALGAGRASLVRQLLLEGLMLATAASAAAGILTWFVLDPVLRLSPVNLPRAGEIRLGLPVVLYATLTALAAGIAIALLPAIRLTSGRLSDSLKTQHRGQTLSLSVRAQGVLVVSELALAVALTMSAILLTQSFLKLQRIPLGFDGRNVMTASVSLPVTPSANEPQQFFSALVQRVNALPGVEAVGAISDLPLVDTPPPDDFTIEGQPVPEPSDPGMNAHYVMVTPGAFEALGISVIRGRPVRASDDQQASGVALINEAAAAKYWRGRDPVGNRIRYATGVSDGRWSGWGPWLTIVGIAADVRFEGPSAAVRPAIYVSHAQRPRASYPGSAMTIVMRHEQGASSTAPLRDVARELHGGATISAARSMDAIVAATMARPQMMGWMMGAFAVIGLGIAALGVYGVIAYVVARRTREIGLRVALGSTRRGVAWLLGRQTMVLLIAGLALGGGAAAWMARYMRAVLFGVQPLDPATFATVAVILGAVVCAAAAVPIRRALMVDPLTALRTE